MEYKITMLRREKEKGMNRSNRAGCRPSRATTIAPKERRRSFHVA